MTLNLSKIAHFQGEIIVPGSKSISNRVLLLSSLASGTTVIENLPTSDDVKVLLSALPLLGINAREKTTSIEIDGANGFYPIESAVLNLENAGTALRPLTAILAFGKGNFVVDGNEHMRKRPIKDLVEGLHQLSIDVKCPTGCPPIEIRTTGVDSGFVTISGQTSSQYLSALLLAAPLVRGELVIQMKDDPVSKPYIDMTISLMKAFGVGVKRTGYSEFKVQSQNYVSPGKFTIEPDASSASYFMAAGAISGPVKVKHLSHNSLQGDFQFVEVLKQMGAKVTYFDDSVLVERGSLRGIDIDMSNMPDAAMTLAVLALFAKGTTRITGIGNLRVKESERIRGLNNELSKLGAHVIEEQASLTITPPEKIQKATIETYDDHRMAMAFSLAAFGNEVEIQNPECTRKTYPGYFKDFLKLVTESG